MGQWGGGLYESDHVCDLVAGKMSEDLRIAVNYIDIPDYYRAALKTHPKSKAAIRKHLNKGHFTRVFIEYKNTTDVQPPLITGPHACVILAAKAMNVGANITADQRQYLRSIYKKCGLHMEGIEQMGKALDDYVNGTPYTLIEPDRTDHNIQMAFDGAKAKHSGSLSTLNYTGPRFYEENVPTRDLTYIMLKRMQSLGLGSQQAYYPNAPVLRECARCEKLPVQVQGGLRECVGCQKVMYCDKECQKKDWPKHKKWCKTFAAMPAPPSTESLEKSPMCVPGYDPLVEGMVTQGGLSGGATAPGASGGGAQPQCATQ